ncbi:batten's disease protein Cln3 [Lactarius akahatsu]|uniref:Protein BTN n=1 Tax=Lactarius akahatsu TaxID=416441 RepID=A0AAD4L9M9_9AGAM|nr:batten's disease protein Cln3 [Lactarius akahatsu]
MSARLEQQPEQFELPTFMDPETRLEEDERLLSQSENDKSAEMRKQQRSLLRLSLSFFLFGLINNVLYVIILSAALDLVPPVHPQSIVAKFSWPYILKGRIRYVRRLVGCCFLSVMGMIVVATSDGLSPRLFGIGCASLASGLGEVTFLQLSTTFHPPSVAGRGVGYFASGTGAAGLVGAFLWWELRGLGVRIGVGLSSVLPFVIPLTYFLLLPRPNELSSLVFSDPEEAGLPSSEYTPLPVLEEDAGEVVVETAPLTAKTLSLSDKWELLKPMLPRYMAPLCVAPTLVYPIPTPDSSPVFGRIVHSIRDYYPLWQLVYQSTVFLSRSSLSLGLPALPTRAIPIPSVIQGLLLAILSSESALGYFPDALAPGLVFCLISVEGICGGLSYVNAYFRAGLEPANAQERAFKMGAIGLADSLGILAASLVAMPTEVALCRAQVGRGRLLCQEL